VAWETQRALAESMRDSGEGWEKAVHMPSGVAYVTQKHLVFEAVRWWVSSYFLNSGSTSVLGEDYEQNGVDKKRDRVRLNRIGGRKMGQLYGGIEAGIGRSLKSKRVQESRDRESAEGSENGIRIMAPARGFWGA